MTASATSLEDREWLRSRGRLSRSAVDKKRWPPVPVAVLLMALVSPWVFSVGSLAISPYRLVLLALLVPCLVRWMTGKAGKIRLADILLLLFCIWSIIALIAVHGLETGLESGGMLLVESMGGYLVARCYIRSAEDFRATAKLLFLLVLLLLPFAIAEAVTGQRWLLKLFRAFAPTIAEGQTDPRWGLTRVQGPLEHPILFGVFCGAPLAMIALVYRGKLGVMQRYGMAGLVALTAMLSLSSGPIVAMLVQIGLLVWNGVLRNVASRWRILWVLTAVSYLALEIPTSQTVPMILTRFAFDQWTAFYRLLIFDYGWQSVMAHPFFGTGFNDWLHPSWMSSSIDMLWLVPAVRHGLPAFILYMGAFFAAALAVGFQPGLDGRQTDCRTAYMIFLTALFLAGWTVHFWNATFVLFMFLVGSGLWLCDATAEAEPKPYGLRGRRPSGQLRRPAPQQAQRTRRSPS